MGIKQPTIRSIREVARLAEVAPSTVSLVLNGIGRVSDKTRERVLLVSRKSGYRPGHAGRKSLRPDAARAPGRINRIALVHAGLTRSAIHSPVYMDVLRGVEESVSSAGTTLILRHVPRDQQRNTGLFPLRVDGVIIFGTAIDAGMAAYLSTFPCVGVMGSAGEGQNWDRVTYTNEPIGRIAAEFLRGHGHDRAAVISAADNEPVFRERANVFTSTWARMGGKKVHRLVDAALLVDDTHAQWIDPDRLRDDLDALLSVKHPPTGLFLVSDMLAGPVQAELLRRGLVPGRDIDLIACNNERLLLDPLHPRPATIDIHAGDIGQRAAVQLLWRIEHPEESRKIVLIEPQLVYGGRHSMEAQEQEKNLVRPGYIPG